VINVGKDTKRRAWQQEMTGGVDSSSTDYGVLAASVEQSVGGLSDFNQLKGTIGSATTEGAQSRIGCVPGISVSKFSLEFR